MQSRLRSWARSHSEAPPLGQLVSPELTVVVPCYGHAEHLPYAVESLLGQTIESFNTVLVDDGSPDGTADVLPKLADALSRRGGVTVLRQMRNQGQSATLNAAIAGVATPLITVLNDDDCLAPLALAAAVESHISLGDVALVGLSSQWFTGTGGPPAREHSGWQLPSRVRPEDVRGFRHVNDLNMTHSGMTLRRAAWDAVGGYVTDPRRRVVPFSDRDLQLRIAALYPVAVIAQPLVWWRADSSVDAGVNS